ncbi:MAG: hypothetical protein KC619_07355 [Myxococcales bacterium]|nr:hypothetical protein [Myxococcales bacterium]
MKRALPWLAALALTAAVTPEVRAGDRPLQILLVNMTPDAAVTEPARQCMRDILARVREEDSTVSRMGETALRRLVGHPGTGPFMGWPHEDLVPVIERESDRLDSVVLVDCRPEEQFVDVLVSSPAGAVTRITLRDVAIDRHRARWIAETFLRQSWNGFSP